MTIRFMLALCLLGHFQLAGAIEPKSQMSNFVYELKSADGRILYLYGSAHNSPSLAPIHLGQCVKNLLMDSKSVVLEGDQLATRVFVTTSPKTISMSQVVEFIDKEILEAITIGLFGQRSDSSTRLITMDAQTLLTVLNSRISGSAQHLGILDYGPDTEIEMAARFLNKPATFLESPEDQFRHFQLVSPKDFASAIAATYKIMVDQKSSENYYRGVLDMYKAATEGDETALLAYFNQEGFSGYQKTTMLGRNESLATKVGAVVASTRPSPIFAALGAIHLAGENGVPRRLERQGFAVKRLCQ